MRSQIVRILDCSIRVHNEHVHTIIPDAVGVLARAHNSRHRLYELPHEKRRHIAAPPFRKAISHPSSVNRIFLVIRLTRAAPRWILPRKLDGPKNTEISDCKLRRPGKVVFGVCSRIDNVQYSDFL